jgi:hypothetical protein
LTSHGHGAITYLRAAPKSDGFASSLFDPGNDFPLSRFCIEQSIDYSDERTPVRLQTFVDYALAFRERFVPNLDETIVTSMRQDGGKFVLNLSDGTCIQARRVVVAIGVERFRYMPAPLDILPVEFVSHSYNHHDLNPFTGRRVAVIGAGASAIVLAGLLNERGCEVQLICRSHKLKFANPPAAGGSKAAYEHLRSPGFAGGRAYARMRPDFPFCEAFRGGVRRHLGSAAGWPMRDKVIGRSCAEWPSTDIAAVADVVRPSHSAGTVTMMSSSSDHIIAPRGYRVDIRRLDFLEPGCSSGWACQSTPILSTHFESSIEGFFCWTYCRQ